MCVYIPSIVFEYPHCKFYKDKFVNLNWECTERLITDLCLCWFPRPCKVNDSFEYSCNYKNQTFLCKANHRESSMSLTSSICYLSCGLIYMSKWPHTFQMYSSHVVFCARQPKIFYGQYSCYFRSLLPSETPHKYS